MDTPPYSELLIGCGASRQKRLSWNNDTTWKSLTTLDNNPDHRPDVLWDLMTMPLPFADDSFNEIHAYEVLEHTGAQGDYKFFFAQFSEFWRILRPGGFLLGTTPMFNSPWAWGDPSHTRIINRECFAFLDQNEYVKQVGKTAMSDFRYLYQADFVLAAAGQQEDTFQFILQAVKPSRYVPPAQRPPAA
jgi:SAM-dependent methyltransferase